MPACQAQTFQTLPKTPREPEHNSGLGLSVKHTSVFLSAIVKAPMVGNDLGDSFDPIGIYLQCPSLTFLLLPQITKMSSPSYAPHSRGVSFKLKVSRRAGPKIVLCSLILG